jgi:TRAP-type C4-dicarboxylate transport system permease small subunit
MMFFNTAHAGVITDAPRLSTILENVLNLVLSIVGVLAILVIVVAGIMYITSSGNLERATLAKRALTGGIIGICVVILSLIIVRTIVNLV